MMGIKIRNLTKSYSGKRVFYKLNADLPDTGYVAILGHSGIGKSSLLRMIAGLEEPDAGEILFFNPSQPKISIVFQEDRLLPHLSARENVALVGNDHQQDLVRADQILDQLGLEDCKTQKVNELSGGMKRRVALARALLYGGDIFLLDECFAGLDKKTRVIVTNTFIVFFRIFKASL